MERSFSIQRRDVILMVDVVFDIVFVQAFCHRSFITYHFIMANTIEKPNLYGQVIKDFDAKHLSREIPTANGSGAIKLLGRANWTTHWLILTRFNGTEIK